ncbi:helix-turn-helix domain-containing protein [Mycobacteroides abscessus]|uniref:helix-turn-helix domain-containing protein n=1 Tax=Mycobacteroides abscessus TaxID=36809 RepID=UPI000925B0D8|nr:helix-turn-helix domain-containing protein [Mycobacteroides abscessus]SIC21538.1 XRE family transcriptional regulator [Mycobacteroides abscessus subsp. abscessus]
MPLTFDGAKLKAARESAGMSRTQLAAILESDDETVRKWEIGSSSPSPAKLLPLAAALNVQQTDLHSGEGALTLKDLRRRAGLNQADVAARAGVSRSVVSNWESGKLAVPQEVRPALAQAYDVTLADVDAAAAPAAMTQASPADSEPARSPRVMDVSEWKGTVEDGAFRVSSAWSLVEPAKGKVVVAAGFMAGSPAAEHLEQAAAHLAAALEWFVGRSEPGNQDDHGCDHGDK